MALFLPLSRVIAKSHFRNGGRRPAGRRGKPAGLPHHFGNDFWQPVSLTKRDRERLRARERSDRGLRSIQSNLSPEHNDVLSRQRTERFDPFEREGGHFPFLLRFAHLVDLLDRHLGILGAKLDENDAAAWLQTADDGLHHFEG